MKILIDGPDQILYQWDKGQRLMLHGADAGTRVDFARCDQNKAVSVYAYAEDGAVFCDIPDSLLMDPNHLHGYVYEIDGDRGETVREFMLPVIRRPMPEDYVAPDEVLTWHELEQRIKKIEDEGVPDEKIAQAVEDYLEENPIEVPEVDLTGIVKSVNGKTPDENGNVEITIPDSSQNVDLTGYAKEQWVKDNYQPKGEYLTEETDPTVPSWAKQPTKPKYTAAEVGAIPDTTEIPVVPTKVSAFENDAGYLTEHQDLSGYAKTEDIPTTLPNPNALTFTGAATGTYDGSAPLTVNIPAGWGGTTPTTAEKIVDYAVDADSASATSFAFTVADYPKLAKYNHLRGIFRKSTNGSMPWVQVVLNAAAINHANRIGRMEPTSYGMCGFEITNNAGYYLGGVTDSYNPSMYSEWVMASFPDICNRRAFPLYLKELTMVSVSSYATFLDEGGKIEIWGWND